MIMKRMLRNGVVRVTFTMPVGIWADTIHLVGDFNNWDTLATPLRLDEQNWSVSLDLDVNKAYQYRYLINGKDWYNDWRADSYAPNNLGGDNSVVVTTPQYADTWVTPSQRDTYYPHRTAAARQPLTSTAKHATLEAEPASSFESYEYETDTYAASLAW